MARSPQEDTGPVDALDRVIEAHRFRPAPVYRISSGPAAVLAATANRVVRARSALSQMDVPTRTSYVMAVVTAPERPAAASITAVPKTFAWAAGSMISGYLLTLSTFGWPLLIGGVIKGVYDILLLIKFQKVRPPEEAGAAAD
jgi:hypothetical protein